MRTFPLTTDSVRQHDWTLIASSAVPSEWAQLAEQPIPATVPGEVHTDLLAAGAIDDPFDGDSESRLHWIGRTDWTYRMTFDWQPGAESRHDLVADGLDTFATLSLNGTEIGRTVNQHRGYRFEVGEVLRPGSNDLEITFAAPVPAAEAASAALGPRPVAYPHPYNAVRKMACSYGWDWGPDLAGAGIWRPIRIESYDTVRLAAVRPLATAAETGGVLQVEAELEWLPGADRPVILVTDVDGTEARAEVAAGTEHVSLTVPKPDAELWWPRGYGEQPLYPVQVSLRQAQGSGGTGEDDQLLDRWDGRVGFRDIALAVTPDAFGSGFSISVNGQPVYVKGYNWIPDDAFLTRVDPDRYRSAITEAYESGANLLRVWGGGIYESQYFYTVCDELGLLVWQDFLFACAAYSEDEPLHGEIEAEARQAITRLSAHASLAVWNGNNENIWGWVDWGWRPQLGDLSWGDGYYQDLLPRLVAELDPRTPYSPASPYSFADYHHPNDPRHGSMHIWDVWNLRDYTTYRSYRPRFVAEFGFQGPPAWSTLTGVVHDQPLDPYGRQMLVHQKAADGNLKLERGLGDHLPRWANEPEIAIDDWHWLTQLNQARAIRFGIEHFRSIAPTNTGAVVWQLNDNWPVISWAAVDHAGIRKPLWYALRSVFADRLLTIQPREDDHGDTRPTLVAHNDTAEPWQAEVLIRRLPTNGAEVLAEQTVQLHVDARATMKIALDADLLATGDRTTEYLQASAPDAEPAFWYFVEDPKLRLTAPAGAYRATVETDGDARRVTVVATSLVKDLALFPDRLDPAARVDSCLVTLSAGQQHTFTVTGGQAADGAALTARPVLRSVNDTVRP